MPITQAIKSSIISLIANAIPQIHVVDEFNPQDIHSIDKREVVCVYIKQMNTKPIAFGDILSVGYTDQKINTKSGKQISAIIGINIYIRKSRVNCTDSLNCDTIFERIAELLMFENELSATQISRGEISFNPSYQAYVLTAELCIDDIFEKNDESLNLTGFRLSLDLNNGGVADDTKHAT